MKKITLTLVTLALAATSATAQMDCCKSGGAMNAKAASGAKKTAVGLRCPVTGEKIASAAKAGGKSVYKGKTYYFCCNMCKPKFDKAPAKYIKNAAKGVYEKM